MNTWVTSVLQGETFGFISLVAAFLFGLSSAATTAACGGLPAMLVILGYTGSDKSNSRRQLYIAAAAFAISSILVLGSLGAIISLVGKQFLTTQGALGFYFQKILGLAALFIGLSALDMLPMRLPNFKLATEKLPSGALGAIFLGATVGLATAGCAAACSPLQLPIVLNLALLRGKVLERICLLYTSDAADE